MSRSTDTHQKALEVNLDPTSFGSFAEIGAGQEVARWFLRVGAASGTVAKTISAYDKKVSDDLYGSGTRYVSRLRLDTMLECEWKSLLQQIGEARGKNTRLFAFADTVAARNFAGTNDCHGWAGVRFQEQPGAEPSDIVLHANLRDNANLLQQEAVGILGVNMLHALMNERTAAVDLPARMMDNLANNRLEIDEIVTRGSAFAGCDMRALHTVLASDGHAEAVTFDDEGAAIAANEFLYKKSVVVVPVASDPRANLSSDAVSACVETARREVAGNPEVKDVVSVRLVVVEPELPYLASGSGAAMITRHGQLYRITAFVRRYTQAPLLFALSLPELMRIFDDAKYPHLEGRLLEGISRLFGSNVRVLVYPYPREQLLRQLEAEPDNGWQVNGSDLWISAEQLHPRPPLRHLYDYLLASGFMVAVPST